MKKKDTYRITEVAEKSGHEFKIFFRVRSTDVLPFDAAVIVRASKTREEVLEQVNNMAHSQLHERRIKAEKDREAAEERELAIKMKGELREYIEGLKGADTGIVEPVEKKKKLEEPGHEGS